MKLPRDINGTTLIILLKQYGYEQTRQVGSHIRLTTQERGTHHLTIPRHTPLRVGTLNSILAAVAAHRSQTKAEVIDELFG